MSRMPRRVAAVAGLAAAALALSACSAPAATESAPTRAVKDEFDTVRIPVEPQAVLGFYTTDLDMAITLGLPLADHQPIRGDAGYSTFPTFFDQDALAGITPFANYPEYNYEQVAAAQPDLILNGIGADETIRTRLNAIAPTFNFSAFTGDDWRDKFQLVATALGRVAQYEEWTARYDARIAEVRAKIEAKGIDPLVASIGYYAGSVNVSCYALPCLVFTDLGLRISPLADGDGDGKLDADGTNLSLEDLDKLRDIDVAFSSTNVDGSELIGSTPDLADNAIWAGLPVIDNGQLYPYQLDIIYGSPSGQMAFLDVVEKALVG